MNQGSNGEATRSNSLHGTEWGFPGAGGSETLPITPDTHDHQYSFRISTLLSIPRERMECNHSIFCLEVWPLTNVLSPDVIDYLLS